MNRALIHELATGRFILQREEVLLLGPHGTGKSHLAQALGRAAIHQGHRVLYCEAHMLLKELADAALDETRKDHLADLTMVPLLILNDLGMRKLPHTAAEDLLEIIMRTLRARLDAADVKPARRRLGQAARRYRRRHRYSIACSTMPMCSSAGPGAGAPRSTPTCAPTRRRSRNSHGLGRRQGNSGLEPSTNCRF